MMKIGYYIFVYFTKIVLGVDLLKLQQVCVSNKEARIYVYPLKELL